MTAATLTSLLGWPATESGTDTGPEPRKRRQPVFIQDAVTPFRGETVLLAMLKDDLDAEGDQP